MAEFPGALVAAASVLRAEIGGRAVAAYSRATQLRPTLKLLLNDPAVLAAPSAGAATDAAQRPAENQLEFPGAVADSSTPGLDFYERFHVLPRSIALGNVLSTTLVDMEVFSAFRKTAQFWTAYDNNAGAGVTLVGAPSLPTLVQPMAGFTFDLQVDLNGPAVVDSTLDFTFNVTGLIQVPISFQRVVLFPAPPELPYDETLEWLTDVLTKVDGSEQRRAIRKTPRQFFRWDVLVEDGRERSIVENSLFDWQGRTFGVPVWHESTNLAAAITGGSTTVITVGSTADADFRDGGLVLVWESVTKYDVLNLVSHTSTTLTVQNPPTNSYSQTPTGGVLVIPLRLAAVEGDVRGGRYLQGQDRFQVRFRVTEAGVDLADSSSWSTFNSKVLLDDYNFVEGTLPETYSLPVVRIDNGSGLSAEYVRQDRHRRASQRRFVVATRAGLWRVRQLLHALRGRQISFYLPTFSKDLVPAGTMTSGQTTLAVENVGYTNLIRSRQPKNVIRVVPVAGAGSPFLRTIVSSTVVDSATENITVSSSWPSTLTPAQIERISFVEKVRSDSDRIVINHGRGTRRVVTMPVRTVLE